VISAQGAEITHSERRGGVAPSSRDRRAHGVMRPGSCGRNVTRDESRASRCVPLGEWVALLAAPWPGTREIASVRVRVDAQVRPAGAAPDR
jgi:hypothetical protein